MTYLNKMEHIKQRTCVVSDTSIISPLSVLLFNQIGFTSVKRDSNSCDKTEDVIITINNLKNVQLSCDAEFVILHSHFVHCIFVTFIFYIIYLPGLQNYF